MEANLIPALVDALRRLRASREHAEGSSADTMIACEIITCLKILFSRDMTNVTGIRKCAFDAGIVPVFTDWLRLGHEPAVVKIVEFSFSLLVPVPPGEVGPLGDGLLQAVATLLNSDPPIARRNAANLLSRIASVYPGVVVDYRTWGIADSVQRLRMHSDPATAAAARKLFLVLSSPNVSSCLTPPHACAACFLLSICVHMQGLCFCLPVTSPNQYWQRWSCHVLLLSPKGDLRPSHVGWMVLLRDV
jgi:hypothetical protein